MYLFHISELILELYRLILRFCRNYFPLMQTNVFPVMKSSMKITYTFVTCNFRIKSGICANGLLY